MDLLETNITNIIFLLIKKSKRRKELDSYSELHHIIPKSLGGDDKESNLVRLTYREHFLSHWLLTKFTEKENKRKMSFALSHMKRRGNQIIVSSWRYEIIKRSLKEALKGRKLKDSTKIKLREIALKQREDEKYMQNWKEGIKNGKKPEWSDERKELYRERRIEYNKSEKFKIMISEKLKGVPKTEKAKQNMRIAKQNGGCAFGDKNAMSKEENRKKVSLSKIGRKKLIKGDKFKYSLPNSEQWINLLKEGYSPMDFFG